MARAEDDALDEFMRSIDAPEQVSGSSLSDNIRKKQHGGSHEYVDHSFGALIHGVHSHATTNSQLVRNRRFRAVQNLLKTEYFDDDEMERRAPDIFHSILGQVIEKTIVEQSADDFAHWELTLRPTHQYGSPARGSSSSERSEVPEFGAGRIGINIMSTAGEGTAGKKNGFDGVLTSMLSSAGNRQQVRDQLTDISEAGGIEDAKVDTSQEAYGCLEAAREYLVKVMVERFLAGKDAAFFDYAAVDDDASLDLHPEAVYDIEERYFGTG